jgi:hypothetical protein
MTGLSSGGTVRTNGAALQHCCVSFYMSTLIDFSETRRSALLRGFLKGLAAPVVLFSHHSAPALPQVTQITPPVRPYGDAGVLSSDWARIGLGLHAATTQHAQASAQTTDPEATGR